MESTVCTAQERVIVGEWYIKASGRLYFDIQRALKREGS